MFHAKLVTKDVINYENIFIGNIQVCEVPCERGNMIFISKLN